MLKSPNSATLGQTFYGQKSNMADIGTESNSYFGYDTQM